MARIAGTDIPDEVYLPGKDIRQVDGKSGPFSRIAHRLEKMGPDRAPHAFDRDIVNDIFQRDEELAFRAVHDEPRLRVYFVNEGDEFAFLKGNPVRVPRAQAFQGKIFLADVR